MPPAGNDAEDWYSPAVVRSELAWVEALAHDTDLPLLTPERTDAGDALAEVRVGGAPAVATLISGPAGEWRKIQSREEFLERLAACARGTAALHQHAERWQPPGDFTRPAYGRRGWERPLAVLEDLARDDVFCPSDFDLIAEACEHALSELDHLEQTPATWGVIHGNLSWRHWLDTPRGKQPTGFELCGYGYYLYDLAVALARTHYSAREHFLDAYRAVRPVPDGVERPLGALLLLQRVRALGREAADPGNWPALARTAHHLANSDARDILAGRCGVYTG